MRKMSLIFIVVGLLVINCGKKAGKDFNNPYDPYGSCYNLPAPTGLQVDNIIKQGDSSWWVSLTWDKLPDMYYDYFNGFKIYMSTSANGVYSTVVEYINKDYTSTTTIFSPIYIDSAGTYYFKITSISWLGNNTESPKSGYVQADCF